MKTVTATATNEQTGPLTQLVYEFFDAQRRAMEAGAKNLSDWDGMLWRSQALGTAQGGRHRSSGPVVEFRMLNIVDDVNRECLATMPDTLTSRRCVARTDRHRRLAWQADAERLLRIPTDGCKALL